jgi:hypothetical protein
VNSFTAILSRFWSRLGLATQHDLSKLMKTLNETLEEVRAVKTVADSLITLTASIKARLDEVLAGGLNPEQQAKVDAIFIELEDEKTSLAKALTDNTPPVA